MSHDTVNVLTELMAGLFNVQVKTKDKNLMIKF